MCEYGYDMGFSNPRRLRGHNQRCHSKYGETRCSCLHEFSCDLADLIRGWEVVGLTKRKDEENDPSCIEYFRNIIQCPYWRYSQIGGEISIIFIRRMPEKITSRHTPKIIGFFIPDFHCRTFGFLGNEYLLFTEGFRENPLLCHENNQGLDDK